MKQSLYLAQEPKEHDNVNSLWNLISGSEVMLSQIDGQTKILKVYCWKIFIAQNWPTYTFIISIDLCKIFKNNDLNRFFKILFIFKTLDRFCCLNLTICTVKNYDSWCLKVTTLILAWICGGDMSINRVHYISKTKFIGFRSKIFTNSFLFTLKFNFWTIWVTSKNCLESLPKFAGNNYFVIEKKLKRSHIKKIQPKDYIF